MELKEISIYEAQMYNMPATDVVGDETIIWYALDDDGEYKGFMEITQYDDINEISFFIVPDLYKGDGLGNRMLELFLEQYIPTSSPKDMLTAVFDYSGDFGQELNDIFSDHGFDIRLSTYKGCTLSFDTVYKRLSSKKKSSYSGRMVNLTEGIREVLDNREKLEENGITVKDIREANMELSVAALSPEGTLEALLLVSEDDDFAEAQVTNLFTATDDITVLRSFLSFAVENAGSGTEPPSLVSFVAVNEKLELVMNSFFDKPDTFKTIIADAEFNLGRYIEQLKVKGLVRR